MINKREIEMERRNAAEAFPRPLFCIGRQPDREQRRRYPRQRLRRILSSKVVERRRRRVRQILHQRAVLERQRQLQFRFGRNGVLNRQIPDPQLVLVPPCKLRV